MIKLNRGPELTCIEVAEDESWCKVETKLLKKYADDIEKSARTELIREIRDMKYKPKNGESKVIASFKRQTNSVIESVIDRLSK